MKKAILLILALFILISIPLNICAKKEEPYNYGETWNGWTEYQKYVYLWGFRDGLQCEMIYSLTVALEVFPEDNKSMSDHEVDKQVEFFKKVDPVFSDFDLKITRSIMNDLYNDAANSYIYFETMIEIANKKLSGVTLIDKILENAREEVISDYELISKFKE